MSLLRSSAWVFGGILLGRVLGYVRELAIAGTFGVSATTDVIQATLVIPDLMFNLLVGGAVGAALVPEFARLSRTEKWALHIGALRLFAGLLALLAAVLAVFPQVILAPVASGFSPEKRAIAEPLIRIIVFVVPLTGANAITRALLNSEERFATASLTTVVYNLALVAGVFAVAKGSPYEALALAAVAGAGLAWMAPLAEAKSAGLMAPTKPLPVSHDIVRRYVQALSVGLIVFLLPQAAKSAASWWGSGAYSTMHYATKLIELPLGTVLTVLGVVLFPRLAKRFGESAHDGRAVEMARAALRITLVMALAVAIPLYFEARDFVQVFFGYGQMTEGDIRAIATLVTAMVAGLVGQACLALLTAVANARRDTKTPLCSGIIGVIAGIAVGWALGGTPAAIAWAYSVAFLSMALAQLGFLTLAKVPVFPGLVAPRFLAATGTMAILGFAASHTVSNLPPGWPQVLAAVTVGIVLSFVGALIAGLKADLRDLRGSGNTTGEAQG